MKRVSAVFSLFFACISFLACAQTERPVSGVYRSPDREIIVENLADISAQTAVEFPSGRVRVLRPSTDGFEFGETVFDGAVSGRVRFRDGDLEWMEQGGNETMRRLNFATRDVKFSSGDHELAGTLTLPVGEAPFLTVVLLHDGGPQDRNF